tara:strand:- start:374 stop:685 length:312 start_codon:yes stop_codon:yes gene_type:complete
MKIIGKLVKKLQVEAGTTNAGKSWEKQSILVEQSTKYNKEVVIEFFGDRVKEFRDIKEGSQVEVSINLSSREFNGKYYHNIDGWAVAKLEDKFVTDEETDVPF